MNILIIMADQLAASAVGAYGNEVTLTPHLDELAARGTLFQNAYCNSPLCVPSRASMVTGRLSCAIASYDNGSELPASIPTFMHHLRLAGYRTILTGKMHFVGADQSHGFEERLTTDIYHSNFDWTPDWRRGAYGNSGTSVKQLKKSGPVDRGYQLFYDEEVHFRAIEKIRRLASETDGRPFFFCVSYTHPHDPFTPLRRFWDLYEKRPVPPPAAPALPLEAMHPYNQWIQIHHEMDRYPATEDDVARSRRGYLGQVSYFDEKVGALVEELRRQGMADDTVVLVCSDHGDMHGEHGMWFKRTFYDESTRVPLIAVKPGAPGGRVVPQAVSLVDLFPTILDLAGAPIPESGLDGHSVAPFFDGDLPGWKDEAMCEYLGEGPIRPMRSYRHGRYKYVYVHDYAPLLFDMEADPHELRDLAGKPEFASVETAMRETILRGWDPGAQTQAILQSQQERLFISEAMRKGARTAWDFQPFFDATLMYSRRHWRRG